MKTLFRKKFINKGRFLSHHVSRGQSLVGLLNLDLGDLINNMLGNLGLNDGSFAILLLGNLMRKQFKNENLN